MRRRLSSVLSVLSLLLLSAMLVLWLRSHGVYDQINWCGGRYGFVLSSGDGVLSVTVGPNYSGPDAFPLECGMKYFTYARPKAGGIRELIKIAEYRRFGWMGFAYDPNRLRSNGGPPRTVWYSGRHLYFPHGVLLAAFGVLPSLWAWRRRTTRRRTRTGLCVRCGYDLRASTARCPECGELIPASGVKANAL